MMSKNPEYDVDLAFDPEKRAAQADLNLYLITRPEKGRSHPHPDPESHTRLKNGKYFDAVREHHYNTSQVAYEDMSAPELARKLGEAEFYDDQTSIQNIEDVLLDKIGELEEAAHSTTKKDKEHSALRSDKIFDRIMGIKDRELAFLEIAEATEDSESDDVEQTDQWVDADDAPDINMQSPATEDDDGAAAETPQTDAPEETKSAEKKIEADWEKTHGAPVQLTEAKDGSVIVGIEFDTPGDVLDWSTNEHTNTDDRVVVLTAEDGSTIYVRGNDVYHFRENENGELQDVSKLPLDPGTQLPATVIGETWEPSADWDASWYLPDENGEQTPLKISKALMVLNKGFEAAQAYNGSSENRRPFGKQLGLIESIEKHIQDFEAQLAQVQADLQAHEAEQSESNDDFEVELKKKTPETSTVAEAQDWDAELNENRRNVRNGSISQRAAAHSVGWFAAAKNYFQNKEKGRRRKWGLGLGAVALAGLAYAEIKGVGVSSLLNGDEHQQAGTGGRGGNAQQNAIDQLDGKKGGNGNAQKDIADQFKDGKKSNTPVDQQGSRGGNQAIEQQNGREMTLRQDNFIWTDVERMVSNNHPNISYDELQDRTARAVNVILPANGIDYDIARDLPTGYSYTIPQDVLEKIIR